MSKKVVVYSDGASRGNPGEASIGAVIKDESGNVIKEISQYLGIATNNEAEYTALLEAIRYIKTDPDVVAVDSFADSQLMVRQLNGQYKVKNERLRVLYKAVIKDAAGLNISYSHVPREQNKDADRLANLALDKR